MKHTRKMDSTGKLAAHPLASHWIVNDCCQSHTLLALKNSTYVLGGEVRKATKRHIAHRLPALTTTHESVVAIWVEMNAVIFQRSIN